MSALERITARFETITVLPEDAPAPA